MRRPKALPTGGLIGDGTSPSNRNRGTSGAWAGSGDGGEQGFGIGNPGNTADTTVMSDSTTGYGQVKYTFNIGTYDVTVAQLWRF